MLSNISAICVVIDNQSNRTQCNSMGNSEAKRIANSEASSFDEAVMHVITQSDFFLSWDLQIFIYLISLMTIS